MTSPSALELDRRRRLNARPPINWAAEAERVRDLVAQLNKDQHDAER